MHCSRRQGGFSLVELVVAVVVLAIIAAVMVNKYVDYSEEAEKLAMEKVTWGIRAALHMRVAGLLAREADHAIPLLTKQNPIEWLAEKPTNYAGAYYGVAPPELVQPRSWYYDKRVHELVYRAARTQHLKAPHNPYNDIRFKVWTEQGALPGADMLAEPLRGIRRLEFAPVEPYEWTIASR